MNPLTEKYPDSLEACLEIMEGMQYKAYGHPVVFLYYDYKDKYWSVLFRNPRDSSLNPDIKEDTPLKAVHKLFDYLRKHPRE